MKIRIGDEDQYENGDDSSYENNPDSETSTYKIGKKKNVSFKGSRKHVFAILLAVLAGYLAYTMIAGPRIGECRKLVKNLQTSCNELDLLGIADCMNPNVRNAIYIAAPAGAALTQTSTEEILKEAVNMIGGGLLGMTEDTNMQLSDFFQRLSIKPVRYGLPGKQRTITCRLMLGGVTQDFRMVIKKRYGEVYIDSIELKQQ